MRERERARGGTKRIIWTEWQYWEYTPRTLLEVVQITSVGAFRKNWDFGLWDFGLWLDNYFISMLVVKPFEKFWQECLKLANYGEAHFFHWKISTVGGILTLTLCSISFFRHLKFQYQLSAAFSLSLDTTPLLNLLYLGNYHYWGWQQRRSWLLMLMFAAFATWGWSIHRQSLRIVNISSIGVV